MKVTPKTEEALNKSLTDALAHVAGARDAMVCVWQNLPHAPPTPYLDGFSAMLDSMIRTHACNIKVDAPLGSVADLFGDRPAARRTKRLAQ